MNQSAEQIVRLFAKTEAPWKVLFKQTACGLCGLIVYVRPNQPSPPNHHAHDCPWRLANEWVEQYGPGSPTYFVPVFP